MAKIPTFRQYVESMGDSVKFVGFPDGTYVVAKRNEEHEALAGAKGLDWQTNVVGSLTGNHRDGFMAMDYYAYASNTPAVVKVIRKMMQDGVIGDFFIINPDPRDERPDCPRQGAMVQDFLKQYGGAATQAAQPQKSAEEMEKLRNFDTVKGGVAHPLGKRLAAFDPTFTNSRIQRVRRSPDTYYPRESRVR